MITNNLSTEYKWLTHMIPRPYLLFLGETKDDLAIKTATDVHYWRNV